MPQRSWRVLSEIRALYEARIRGSYRTRWLAQPYEARTTAGTSLVAPPEQVRASYSVTSLVYEALLVYDS